jgi:hypothetical protein
MHQEATMQPVTAMAQTWPLAFLRRLLAAAALGLLCARAPAAPTSMQTWTERPFNPAVGSHWLIVGQTDSESFRETVHQDQHIRTRSELTIEAKLPDGYRIAYVMRDISVTGTAPGTEMVGTAFSAMKDITVRARTDASGMPIAVENLAEVRTAMQEVVERMADNFKDKPKMAALIRELFARMLSADEVAAARAFTDVLPALAAGQNTGLKPGEVRRKDDMMNSLLGGAPVKAVLTTRLARWDNAAGTARIVRTRTLDPESLKAMAMALAGKFVAAAIPGNSDTAKVMEIMKQISFTMDSETTIDIRDGMARKLEEHSSMTASMMGHTSRKVETKTVTVTPAP